jgi:plastocyanin
VLARKTAVAAVGSVVAALAVPALAQAATKVVDMGTPLSSQKAFQSAGGDVNDFFPHGVTIHAGDKVKFVPTGFHSVDIPARGSGQLALITPTGAKVAGSNDAAGQPFWFNGQDVVGFNSALLAGKFGKSLKYTGAKRVESGLPLAPKNKPVTVRFTKAGNYTYFCDVHAGMKGVVHVKKSGKVPSKKADKKALKRQVARGLKVTKALSTSTVPANTIDVGVAGAHGEELYAFKPAAVQVPVGTTLRFRMSPTSFEDHTATTGPGDPEKDPSSYLGQIAASFQGTTPDPRAVYPSEPPTTTASLTPLLHGNGFWNSGVMDTSAATPLAGDNSVTFGAPGTYQFYCMIHPFMHATVTVQ